MSLLAQTANVVPESLTLIPTAQLAEGSYWQQVRIGLAHDDAPAQQAIRLDLPAGVVVDDLDGDGALFDEVRVVYRAVDAELPRFRAATATTDSQIVLTNQERAGQGGELYVQFPIRITAPPSLTSTAYRGLTFADPREQDLATDQLPVLRFVDAVEFAVQGSMGLVAFAPPLASAAADTATSALGTWFPEQPAGLVSSLPDLVFDGGLGNPNRGPGQGDGDDANDTVYRFFLATSATLTEVNAEVASEALRADDETPYTETEGSPGGVVRLLTRDLAAGTYWLYVTSQVTGDVPLGRSRAINVRHQPVIDRLGPTGSDPFVFDSGGLFDASGLANGEGVRRMVLDLEVVDHDDEATLHLFYSGNPNLGESNVDIQGETVILEGATAITIMAGVPEAERRFAWNTVGPPAVAEGDYYLYGVAVGGAEWVLTRTEPQILVRHTPFLRFDPLDDDGAETVVVTGGPHPQRYLTLTWGRAGIDGDGDVDGDAVIDLFYSAETEFDLPGGAEQLLAAAADSARDTHTIATGLREDADGRADNQFIWDLWSLHGTAAVPDSGLSYRVYGLIADGADRRLVQMNGGRRNDGGARLRFSHPPTIRPRQPVVDVNVDVGRTARVSWEDLDLDDDARIRVVLSAEDHGSVSTYDVVTAGLAFVVNSENGRAQPEIDDLHDLREDSATDDLDVGVEHMLVSMNADSPPEPGTYHVYIAIEEGERFDGDTRAWRTPGGLNIADPRTAADPTPFRLLPEAFAIGTGGEAQRMDVVIDAGGDTVDLAQVVLRLDETRFAVTDQDTVAEGLQPFAVAPSFSGAKLVSNAAVSEDGSLFLRFEYFDPGPSGIPRLDGTRALVRFEIAALEGAGEDVVVSLVDDAEAGRRSQLELDGVVVRPGADADLATARLVPGRATASGRVRLEGRASSAVAVDMALRRLGEFADVLDPVFEAANDEDPETEGVQVTLSGDGSFTLQQLPPGRYDLHLRRAGYLEGRAAGVELYAGAEVTDLRPSTSGEPGDSLLLGGDVAGYTDTNGASLPDNEISLADWDYMASLFGRTLAAEDDSARADVSGDGVVNIRDLSLVGANFRRRGPRPVYRAAPGPAVPVHLALRGPTHAGAGDTIRVELRAESAAAAIHALEADLHVHPRTWRIVEAHGPGTALWTHRPQPSGDGIAVASIGGQGLRDTEPLAAWQLVALADDPAPPQLTRAVLLDAAHAPLPARWPAPTAAPTTEAVPAEFGLRGNYPNPFNPATVIEFSVPSSVSPAPVRLEVFDILGQRVRLLVDGVLAPGAHRVPWDGRDDAGRRVASGVYFSRLSAPAQRAVHPMLLLR